MPTIAIDWDDTLVGCKKYGTPGEWLPGAQNALRALLRSGRDVIVHSCRANFAAGEREIFNKLYDGGFGNDLQKGRLSVWCDEGKPLAMVYLDDRALRFEGDWTDLVLTLKEMTRR